MKVGILTYHKSINYGAFLQCYSLAKALSKLPEIDVEVIDYDSRKADIHYKMKICQKTLQSMSLKPYNQYKAFKNTWTQLPLSQNSLITNSLEKFSKYIKKAGYDVVIVGSDEVWKLNGFRGFPNAYWLLGDLNCLKISYAASSRSNLNCLSSEKLQILKEATSDFRYIGVRDEKTYDMIKEIKGDDKLHLNCDPTFTLELDVNKNKGRKILEEKCGINKEDKVIGVMTPNDSICKLIKYKYGKEYKVISIYHPLKSSDYYLGDINPFEWIDLISGLDLFVTSFFHGTIFSMKTKTPFVCIDTYSKEVSESKIGGLLEEFNMGDRLFFFSEINDNINKLYSKIDEIIKEPEYDKIQFGINIQQEKFEEFINKFKLIVKQYKNNLKV